MSSKGNNSIAAIVATAIVAALAIGAAFFAVMKLTEAPAESTATTTTAPADVIPTDFQPTQELVEEVKDAATTLLSNNFEVLKLYVTRGLSHEDEPYGNKPEDGYYTVADTTYTTYAQIETLVKTTYTADEAERILTDCNGKGAVYAERTGKKLGISADFKAADYELTWENVQFKVTPLSETESAVSVYLHKRDGGDEVISNGTLVKENDTWFLKGLVS